MLNCPVCANVMDREDRSGVIVDVCPQHGMWLDKSELLLMTEKARYQDGRFVWKDIFRRPVSPPVDRERVLKSPINGAPMKLIVYRGVTIDWSPGHGVWLDNGELEAIINNLRLDPFYVRGMAVRIVDGEL